MNHFIFPYLNPFKFVPATNSPGVHFDDDWSCEQIKSFERRSYYQQKWKKSETTKLQMESSLAPEKLKVYDKNRTKVKEFTWTAVLTATGYKIYEVTFDISNLPEGMYWLYQQVTFGSIDWAAISEPIHSKTSWSNTHLFTYSNSYNKDGVGWTTGIEMKFRCEAGIMDFEPDAEISSYIDQTRDSEILDGVPYRKFKLYIGKAPGVAPWVLDLLNRIFLCDSVDIDGKTYTRNNGAKWDVSRAKGNPLIGGSLEIVEGTNLFGLNFSETTPIENGLVIAYNIETAFFGPGSLVPVIEVPRD